MSRLGFENTRALRDLQGERGVGPLYLTWLGKLYKFIPGSTDNATLLNAGGLGPEVSAVFICAKEDFATLPTSHQTVTASGKQYRIKSVTVAADDSYISLACVDRNAGA